MAPSAFILLNATTLCKCIFFFTLKNWKRRDRPDSFTRYYRWNKQKKKKKIMSSSSHRFDEIWTFRFFACSFWFYTKILLKITNLLKDYFRHTTPKSDNILKMAKRITTSSYILQLSLRINQIHLSWEKMAIRNSNTTYRF